jgi:hypothetical protein
MSEIREYVMEEPLFDNHEHQMGFSELQERKGELTYREFLGYADADVATAVGIGGGPDLDTEEGFFEAWESVRTTGYGRATEMACRELLGLEFSAENAAEITAALREYAAAHSAEEIHVQLFELAGVRWVLNDCYWDVPTALEFAAGGDQPDFFGNTLRYDDILTVSDAEQMRGFGKALDRDLRSLGDLDEALDDYTERAIEGGNVLAMKAAMPYSRRLDFDDSAFADAERAFEALMRGARAELKPLHDYLFHRFIRRAAEFGLPVQLHTGYLAGNWGDPTRGDPTPLVPVLQRYRQVRFDLFHAGWPYCEVLGTIGKSLPNAWLDLCWAWAMNPTQMERVLDEWLGAVPHNKILGFGGDTGSPFPVPGYALQARAGIARVLEARIERGEFDLETARQVATRIMHKNSRELYPVD